MNSIFDKAFVGKLAYGLISNGDYSSAKVDIEEVEEWVRAKISKSPGGYEKATKECEMTVLDAFANLRNVIRGSPLASHATTRRIGDREIHFPPLLLAKGNYTEHRPKQVHGGGSASEHVLKSHNDINQLEQEFQKTTEGKEREREARERDIQHHFSQTKLRLEEDIRKLQAELQKSESQKLFMREQYNVFIRKQQEESFRQMESARWLPMDEGKVMDDLDRLKRDMRSWAKATSIRVLPPLRKMESAALMQALTNVAPIENSQLPEGLSTTARSPMLLLNALLAHSIYTSFFRSPFFFLGNNDANAPSNVRPEAILEDVYRRVKEGTSIFTHQITFH